MDDKTTQIRIYDVVTEEDSLVLSDDTYKFWFSWSPDQNQILFQRDFHPPNSHIFIVDVTGDNLQPIVDDTNSRNWMQIYRQMGR